MTNRLNLFLPVGNALLVVIGIVALRRNPSFSSLAGVVAGLVLALGLSLWQLSGRSLRRTRFWNLLITPLAVVLAGILFFVFVEDRWLAYATAAALGVSTFVFLELVYVSQHDRPRYQPHALENISANLNILAVFFAASGSLALSIFLGTSPWILALTQGVVWLLLTHQLFWATELPWSVYWYVALMLGLVGVESYAIISLLPSSVLVGAALLTICFYTLSGITRNWLLQIRALSVVRRYAIIGVVSVCIVLLTAQWY